FDATAVALFRFARDLDNPTHIQLKAIAETAAKFRLKHVEFRTIELVAGLPDDQVKRWPPGTTRKLLEVTQDAEDARAIDGRCLPWLRAELDEADQVRRNALRDLCDPKSSDNDMGPAAENLGTLPEKYRRVVATARALMGAFLQYEETRAVLADLAVGFPHPLAPVPKAVATGWTDLAEDFRRLEELLRPPGEPRMPDLNKLDQAAQSARSHR